MLKNSQLNEDNSPSASPCPRTDLACESPGAMNSDAAGTKVRNRQIGGIQISCLEVLSEAGEAATGRRRGTYVTLYCPLMKYMDCEESDNITEALAVMLREMTEKLCGAPV
ncbi:MAG: GPR endopeptidase, partial [Candidatus Avispirillum sp.]